MTQTSILSWTLAQAAPAPTTGSVSASDALSGASSTSGTTAGTGQPGTPAGPSAPQSSGGFPGSMLIMVFGFLALMIFLQFRTASKEKKKQAALMSSLKRGDKVMTLAGILGTVDQVRDDEIVLKVDPNSNTRISFARTAIQTIVNPSSAPAADATPEVEVKAKNEKIAAR